MKTLFYIIVCFISLISCSKKGDSNDKSNAQIIEFQVKNEKVSVFDLFKKLTLIPLETSENSLLKSMSKIEFYKEKYYVYDSQQHIVFIFNEAGKYCGRVGTIGNGPKDYYNINDFCINPSDDTVILMSTNNTLYYHSLDGSFIKNSKLNGIEKNQDAMIVIDQDLIAFWTGQANNTSQISIYSEKANKVINQLFAEEHPFNFTAKNVFYTYNGSTYFSKPLLRRVLKVEAQNISDAYSYKVENDNLQQCDIDFSKADNRMLFDRLRKEELPYLFNKYRETQQFYYVEILINDQKKAHLFKRKNMDKSFIFDEFAEGVSFHSYYWCNDFILGACNMYNTNVVNEKILDEANYKTLSSLTPDDNPCIVKYDFKH